MLPQDGPKYDSLPIPTYEEATSRPGSSQSHRGSAEISDDAERQGLISRNAENNQQLRNGNYHAPTVESGRSSYDSDVTMPELDSDHEDAELRRDLEQMEVVDPLSHRTAQQRPSLRRGFSKRFASITDLFSSLHLPAPIVRLPSFSSITSRFPTIAERYRPSWPILARLFGLLVLVSAVYTLLVVRVLPSRGMLNERINPEAVRQFVHDRIDTDLIRKYLHQISYDDHIAGTAGDYFLAQYVEDHFAAAQLDEVFLETYEVYINYPRADGRRVAIIDPPELAWEAALEEDNVDEVEGGDRHQSLVFHGMSRSGNVTGPLVYANYGAREDFDFLKDQGIRLDGAIVLVKYYGTQGDRALKVKAAELAGAAGCLIYSDPADDGFVKGPVWPDGPWRTSDSVQRGTVGLTSWIVGDMLTPGWASTPDAERLSTDDNPGLVNIPSLPLAWRDAQVLLRGLVDHGIKVPENWIGGVPDLDGWWTGNVSVSPIIHLMNIQDESEKQPIRNVIGRIEGFESPDKVVYVGNHRDSWCFGSVDPGSGTAVFLEVVRVFGELIQVGWRPRRTIIFASWDAEEQNLIGSTEHVEERIDELRRAGVAYLNVDVGVSGQNFRAAGSPLFELPLLRVLGRISDPASNKTIKDMWNDNNSSLEGLGAGSDYVAFQDLAGCSSIDLGFEGAQNGFPYHSCYESFDWMTKFGDSDFQYHATLAEIWSLLLLEISDDPVLSFDFNAYAREVTTYVAGLKIAIARAAGIPEDRGGNVDSGSPVNCDSLEDAAKTLVDNAFDFMKWQDEWHDKVVSDGFVETHETAMQRLDRNLRMSNFETLLLDLPELDETEGDGEGEKASRKGGIPGREQYKHVIFGPQLWNVYDADYFPAVRDALDEKDWERAQTMLDVAAERIKFAAFKLLH